MKQNSHGPLSGRPPKRRRSEAELQDLARAFQADWTTGDMVHTWIHKHEGKAGELSRKVEEGWLWEDVGKAMQVAGITYSSGLPIPAHTLRLKAYLSRNRERERMTAAPGRPAQHSIPTTVPAAAIPVIAAALQAPILRAAPPDVGEPTIKRSGSAACLEPGEPMFRLVSLKAGQPLAEPVSLPTAPGREPSATTKVSDAEILRRVFGKL